MSSKALSSPDPATTPAEEIAKVLGISRERVRQIEAQALKKLKAPQTGKKLRDYLYQ